MVRLHVRVNLVDAAAQDTRFLVRIRGDRHAGSGSSGADHVVESQSSLPAGRFEVESPTGAGVVEIRCSPSERARLLVGVDDARDGPLADGWMVVSGPSVSRPAAPSRTTPFATGRCRSGGAKPSLNDVNIPDGEKTGSPD